MTDYDPVRELIETGRAMAEVWGEWCMDYWPEYAAFLAALDRAERWREERRLVEAEVR